MIYSNFTNLTNSNFTNHLFDTTSKPPCHSSSRYQLISSLASLAWVEPADGIHGLSACWKFDGTCWSQHTNNQKAVYLYIHRRVIRDVSCFICNYISYRLRDVYLHMWNFVYNGSLRPFHEFRRDCWSNACPNTITRLVCLSGFEELRSDQYCNTSRLSGIYSHRSHICQEKHNLCLVSPPFLLVKRLLARR